MAFPRKTVRRDLELPTFIDIIFLLLIFFLLTYSPIPPKVGQSILELNLPEAEGQVQANLNETLETLMIEIVPANPEKPEEGYQVSILLPFEDFGIQKRIPVTYRDAKKFAQAHNRQEILPVDYAELSEKEFLELPAIKLINTQLSRFVEEKFRIPKVTNRIEIRADKDVSFRVIRYIIDLCGSYGDLIPSLIFRTMYQQE